MPFDRRLHRGEVARHHQPERLRIELLSEASRADQIGEDDRDHLAGFVRWLWAGQLRAAASAEARVVGVLATALRTDEHACRLGSVRLFDQRISKSGAVVAIPKVRA